MQAEHMTGYGARMQRRLGRLLREPDPSITIQRAVTASDLAAAYELVHDVYVDQKLIDAKPDRRRVRKYEASPHMATFTAVKNDRTLAVLSVMSDLAGMGLPADTVFASELNELREQGVLGEVTNNAVHPEHRDGVLFLQLTRACFAHAAFVGCRNLFACATPKWARFFRHVLQFHVLEAERCYSEEHDDFVVGCTLDLAEIDRRAEAVDELSMEELFLRRFYYTENPYHHEVGGWAALAKGHWKDVERALFPVAWAQREADVAVVEECARPGAYHRGGIIGEMRKRPLAQPD